MDSMTFARHLLDEAGVAVTPGAAFGSDRHVRISYCCSMKAISEGMDRLEQFLSSL
jgi:aspartate/methionine/tyrosine aminotransferase